MSYQSITQLSLLIQEKLNRLNSGNLSVSELDDLKALTCELHERITILHYKAGEKALLRQIDSVVKHEEIEVTIAEPIRFKFSTKPEDVLAKQTIEPISAETIEKTQLFTEIKEEKIVLEESINVSSPLKSVSPSTVIMPAVSQKLSLAERMQKTRIEDLKNAIGLNQKFLFMNFLFEGENNSYNDAIEKLNVMHSVDEARQYIRELAYIYTWNFEDENVILFTEFAERRFL